MRLRNIPGARETIAESPWTVKEPAALKGHWNSVFEKPQPLHLEIGTGKGRFIMQLAQEHPEINYIGIEKYSSVLLRAIQKREESEINNLYFIRMDAETIADVFEKDEVEKIIVMDNGMRIEIEGIIGVEIDKG